LRVARRLGAGDGAKAGVARLEPGAVDRPVSVELSIPNGRVGRAVQLELRLTRVVDDGVERVEEVEPELDLAVLRRYRN